jgi:hypothetical protein
MLEGGGEHGGIVAESEAGGNSEGGVSSKAPGCTAWATSVPAPGLSAVISTTGTGTARRTAASMRVQESSCG